MVGGVALREIGATRSTGSVRNEGSAPGAYLAVALDYGDISVGEFVLYKAIFGVVLGLVVTPIIALLAIGDDVEERQLKVSSAIASEDEYVEFWPAGTFAKGNFICAACGNQVTVHQVLPRCMVCGERLWERADWSLRPKT